MKGRLYVASRGLRPEFKSKESREFVAKMLDYLDAAKAANAEDPLYTEESLGLNYVEQQALEHFTLAFKKDEAGDFSKYDTFCLALTFYIALLLSDF